jgi:hypothetical protein
MKKSIISPLCSAFIIPGLGQILNNRLKKGVTILGIIFFLFVGGAVKLSFIITRAIKDPAIGNIDDKIIYEDGFSFLWLIIIAFGIIWIYSVVDAFQEGRIIDRISEKENP